MSYLVLAKAPHLLTPVIICHVKAIAKLINLAKLISLAKLINLAKLISFSTFVFSLAS